MAAAAIALAPAAARRTGRFPLKDLATDFGVDYGDVVLIGMAAGGRFNTLSLGRRRQVADASRRIWRELGDVTSYTLYQRIRDVVMP